MYYNCFWKDPWVWRRKEGGLIQASYELNKVSATSETLDFFIKDTWIKHDKYTLPFSQNGELENRTTGIRFQALLFHAEWVWWETGSRRLCSPGIPEEAGAILLTWVVGPSFRTEAESAPILTVKHQLASWADGSAFSQQCRIFPFQALAGNLSLQFSAI